MKFKAICENHLYSKAYSKGNRAVSPCLAVYVLPDYAAKRLKISTDKIFVNIDKVGNTSAASVPIALSELCESGKLKKGDKIIMCAFGGGLSSAACIIEW